MGQLPYSLRTNDRYLDFCPLLGFSACLLCGGILKQGENAAELATEASAQE